MASNRQVASAKALRVFISSRMAELAAERVVVKRALTDAGCAPWLYEADAGARPGSPRDTYLKELYTSDVYLGLFWKTRGAYTVDEFDTARRNDIAVLVYEKSTDEREPALTAFLEEIGDVEHGVSIRRFKTPEELGPLVTADIDRVRVELTRVSTVAGRTYTGTVHGGRFDRTSEVTPIRRHPQQTTNSPRPPEPFVDRQVPLDRLSQAIVAGDRLVGVTGFPGAGKTSVLRELAHRGVVDNEAYAEGLGIYIEGEQWPLAGDLLRGLWSEFYRVPDQGFVPDEATLRADLGVQRALVFVDDVRLPADHVERVGAHVPQSTFVLAATTPPQDTESPLAYVKAVQLLELESDTDIVTLFGVTYGTPIPPDQSGNVAAICRAAGATPGAVTRLANDAWGSGLPLTQWLERSQASRDGLAPGLEGVDEDDRRVLALLAAFGPDLAIPGEILTVLGVGAGPLERLVRSQHIVEEGRDLRLPGSVYMSIGEAVDVETLRAEVFEAAVSWVDDAPAARIGEARAFLLQVLAWGEASERSSGVVALSRVLAPHLAAAGAWDSWGTVARSALIAARGIGDRDAEGWALHEAGTREMMLGESRAARLLLRAARRVRQDLDDPAALAMTRHNISRLPGWPLMTVTISLLVVAVLVTVIAVVVRAGALLDFGEVLSGNTGARYQIFSNDADVAAEHQIQISGDEEFCLVAGEGLVCGSSTEMHSIGEPIAGGPELPSCVVDEVDAANATVVVDVDPNTECVVAVLFAPRLDDDETRRSFTGELVIIAEDGEENVRLRGVGVDPGETSTTQIPGTTTATVGPNGTTNTTVPPENQAPLARDDSADVAEAGTVDILVLLNDSDPESADLTVEVVDTPEHGTVSVAPDGVVVYVHDGSETEQDSFTYRVSDRELFSETATVTVTVAPVNDPPQADDLQVTVDEAGQLRFSLSFTDPDDEVLEAAVSSPPQFGQLEQIDPMTLLYTHDGSETQADTFDYTVTDEDGASDVATVNVTINPVNDPPVAFNQTITNAGCSREMVLTGSDAENDTLQFSIVQPPAFGTVVFVEQTSANSATYRYDVSGEGSYTVSFQFQVDDGSATDVDEVEISGTCIL